MTEQPLSDKKRELICIDGGRGWGYPEPDLKQAIQKTLKELKSLVLRSLSYNEEIVLSRIDTLAKQNFGTLVEDGRNI